MKRRTLAEWIALYNRKTGDEFVPDKRYKLFYFPDKGFCEIHVDTTVQMVVVYQLCGDIHFWRYVVEFLCQALGYHVCATYCIRPIKPYLRLLGVAIESVEYTPLGERYYCREKYTGQALIASPSSIMSLGGIREYYITWEVVS